MNHVMRVLIADDDECLVDALAHRCQALGLVVERAYDGITALRRIDAVEPDLAILDVNMPGGSGLSVCEMLGQDPYLKKIPIIVLTGRTDAGTIAACNRLDALYVLKGPNIWSQLAPLVAERLGLDKADSVDESSARSIHERRSDPKPTRSIDLADGDPRQPHGIPDADRSLDEPPLTEEDRSLDQYIGKILSALGGNSAATDEPDDERPLLETVRPWVLCVDDDADFAATMTFRLAEHGVDVLHARAGMEGYRCAFTHEAKAIILDQEMPNGDGEYILRRLKDNPVTKGIPVIVLTGRKDQALARRMYNMGATRFLTKPVDWGALWHALCPFVHVEHQCAGLCNAHAE